jgi:Ca-activated chloride channel family protein
MPTFPWRAKPLLFAVVYAGALFAQPPIVFRSNVNLVRVIATARTQAGQILGTLTKDEFEIYDNGVKQQIAVFEHQTEQKLSVALLVDTSGSTANDLKYESDSASRFYHALLSEGNPLDRAALHSFNWRNREVVPFTHDLKLLDAQLKLLHGEAGTAMYDAIYLAARELEPREGRKVIVVVTDGGDTTSSKDVHQALEAAQLADATIYAIVAMPITNEAGRNIGGEHALQFMAEGTGGRTFLPAGGAEMDKAFAAIVAELRTQYLLGFYPHDVPLTKNRFHSLEVRVLHPDLRVSARNGYYGEVQGSGGGSGEDRISIAPDRPLKKKP